MTLSVVSSMPPVLILSYNMFLRFPTLSKTPCSHISPNFFSFRQYPCQGFSSASIFSTT